MDNDTSVCLSIMPLDLLFTLVSETPHGMRGGGKVCVCEVNAASGFVREWHTSGMVMHVCVRVCVCDRGPRRLQLMMSFSSWLGNPVIVTSLK